MSVNSLAQLASVRTMQTPTRSSVGKTAPNDPQGADPAKLRDLLVASVPTEIVAPYTAAIAAIAGGVDEPTAANPDPSEHTLWRWVAFGALLLATAALIITAAKIKAGRANQPNRFPGAELLAGLVAATGWGLAVPESPLVAMLEGNARMFVPVVIALVTLAVLFLLAAIFLKKQAPQPTP